MKRASTEFVILSAAKDLATGWIVTVALDIYSFSARQMLHFVQHDKCCEGDFIRSHEIRRCDSVGLGVIGY